MESLSIHGDMLVFSKSLENGNRGNNLIHRTSIGFSDSSMSRMSRYLRSCTSDYKYLVTLTYPEDEKTWFGFKTHFKRFIERCRKENFITRDASIFWFVEFQARGAPHIHFYSTNRIPRIWLSKAWFECVGSNDRKHLIAGTNIIKFSNKQEQRRYALKYAKKNEQKNVPDMFKDEKCFESYGLGAKSIGRMWGIVGCRKTLSADTLIPDPVLYDLDVQECYKRLDLHLNYCFEYSIAKCFTNTHSRIVIFKRYREARIAQTIVEELKSLMKQKSSAFRTPIAQLKEPLPLRTSPALVAMRYGRGRAKARFLLDCYHASMNCVQ